MKTALPTKEYFEREKESGGSKTVTNFIKNKVSQIYFTIYLI